MSFLKMLCLRKIFKGNEMKKYIATLLLPLYLFGAEEVIIEQEVMQPEVQPMMQPRGEVLLEPMPEVFYEMRKSGFLFGVDLSLGEFNTNTMFIPSSYSENAKSFSTMFGLFGGYQYYFDEYFGLRTTLHLSSGTLSDAQYSVDGGELQNTSTPLWLGVRVSVLWDFWQFGTHALGMSAGIGYNAEFYLNHQYSYDQNSINGSNLLQHNLYPILGIHYYFRNHQFELNYRFNGSLNYSSLANDNGFESLIKYNNYFGLSYSFRF